MNVKRKNLTTGVVETVEESPSPEYLQAQADEQAVVATVEELQLQARFGKAFLTVLNAYYEARNNNGQPPQFSAFLKAVFNQMDGA